MITITSSAGTSATVSTRSEALFLVAHEVERMCQEGFNDFTVVTDFDDGSSSKITGTRKLHPDHIMQVKSYPDVGTFTKIIRLDRLRSGLWGPFHEAVTQPTLDRPRTLSTVL